MLECNCITHGVLATTTGQKAHMKLKCKDFLLSIAQHLVTPFAVQRYKLSSLSRKLKKLYSCAGLNLILTKAERYSILNTVLLCLGEKDPVVCVTREEMAIPSIFAKHVQYVPARTI